jgi:hypothetical protein
MTSGSHFARPELSNITTAVRSLGVELLHDARGLDEFGELSR